MDSEDAINLLRRHYDENVLKPELDNGKCDEMKGRIKREFGDRKDLLEIVEGDMPDFEEKWGFPQPQALVMKIPSEAYGHFRKLFGMADDSLGTAFEDGNGILCIFIVDGFEDYGLEHENLHGLHRKTGRALKEFYDDWGFLKGPEKACERTSLRTEFMLLEEIFAYRSNLKKKDLGYKNLADGLKSNYTDSAAEFFAQGVVELEFVPEGGIVSRHQIEKTVKENSIRYLGAETDRGVEALETLEGALPAKDVTKILLGCGPTRKEIESGEYIRPIDELVLWSKHYKEALPSR